MNCPSCQAPVSPGTRFCGNCGSKLAASCPGCRHDNPAGSLYCEACGVPMAQAQGPGDRRVVTVLFTDVSGFTAMSEKLDPEAVTAIVNRFFTVLTRPIYKYGGVVDKYIGDAIMALFGAPVAHEDDPERALAAAWEMQEAAREFASNLEQKTGIRLKVRVGLNTGLVVAGAVGGAQKRDYTVLGDAVNLASKMEAAARPGGILVSDETYRLTRHCWDFVELDPVVVPGRSRAIRVFEPRQPRGPEQLTFQERPAFVGREVELLKLDLALDAALAGTPQLAVLVGEAGIGKSRLAREFVHRHALAKGVRVLRARCLSYQKEVSHALVSSLVSDMVGPTETALDHARLTTWCEAQGSAMPARDAELLGYFLGLPVRSAELKLLAPETLQSLATLTLAGFLLQPDAEPLLLSLNDLQWADDASRAWLASLIRSMGLPGDRPPVMILAQYRPEGEGVLPDESALATTRLRIRPLSSEDGQALIRSFLELKGPVSEEGFRRLLTEALQKAEGNPFYLCELIRSLTDSGFLLKEGSTWRLDPTRTDLALPGSIQGVVAARIDRLGPQARQAIQVASVLGREFSRSLLSEVCQAEVGTALAELVEAELVHHRPRHPGQYTFHQALIQEVAYQGLLVKLRRELHRRAGLLLEEKAAYQPFEQAQVLAYHFREASDPARALKYLHLAALHAQRSFDNAQAKANLLEALALRETLKEPAEPGLSQLMLVLGEVETTVGEYAEALVHLKKALDSTLDPLERAAVRRRIGAVHERLGAYEEAISAYRTSLSELPQGSESLRAGLLGAIAYAEYGLGQFDSAIERCREAMPWLKAPDARKDLAFCHSVTGLALSRLGKFQEAQGHHQAALELREAIEDTLGVGSSCNNLSHVHYELGDFDASKAYLQRAIEAFARVGDQSWIAMGHNNLGAILLEKDMLAEAETHFEASAAISRRIGFASRMALALCNRGEVCTKLGRHSEAVTYLSEGIRALEGLRNLEILPQAYQLLAQAHLAQDRPQEAWQSVVKGLKLVKVTKSEVQRGALYALAGSVYSRMGQPKQALAWISKGIAVLKDAGNQLELGRAWVQLAHALYRDRQHTHAAAAALRARALFKALDARYDRRILDSWLQSLSLTTTR